ncbi:MAG: hypothetical protein ACR2J4_04025, partial [Deinococcus sp.]
ATATTLEGPWTDQGTFLVGWHKMAVLVDSAGAAVRVGGHYHAYAVSFGRSNSGKHIAHFTARHLAGPWTRGSTVVPVGHAGASDAAATDAPFALYQSGKVYLWYMGSPAVPHPRYGLAQRLHLTAGTSPDGPLTFPRIVLDPSSNAANWDHGWIGGVQVVKRPDGTWVMIYNAGRARPLTVASEPEPSLSGMATARSLAGPWTRDTRNPYTSVVNGQPGILENTNIWRTFLILNRQMGRWYLFYNTGPAGQERITFARQVLGD